MKKLLFLIFFIYSFLGFAQQKVSFDYDVTGNQTKRQLCLICHDKNETQVIEVKGLKEEDLLKFFPEDVISYYPNPVKEELFLKWELINGKNVKTIEIYSLGGQLVKKHSNLDLSNKLNIPFNSFPEGVYTVLLLYSNGEQKDIRIIKK